MRKVLAVSPSTDLPNTTTTHSTDDHGSFFVRARHGAAKRWAGARRTGRLAALCLVVWALGSLCPPANAQTGEWTWMGGGNSVRCCAVSAVYGTLGEPAAGNIPGDRLAAMSWTDSSGNFWLFGGYGAATGYLSGDLNDLWEFNPTTNEWAWMSGSNALNPIGVYGTLGVPAAENVPGSRTDAVTWTDSSGNLWLFGGAGVDSAGQTGGLNDLWKFNPSSNQWVWMGGGSTFVPLDQRAYDTYGKLGMYGTLGVPAAENAPGSRSGSGGWTDSEGNLWLFGGSGVDAAGNSGNLGDLWEFNPYTNEWAWIGGSSTLVTRDQTGAYGQPGVYGTLGVPGAGNIPGGRSDAASWTDGSGNLWLWGGDGLDSTGTEGELNDLWEFNPSIGEWMWMGGSSTFTYKEDNTYYGALGVYGTLGAPAAQNIPGGRNSAATWIDRSGNFWLFGGEGFDSAGTLISLDDLWEYFPSSNEWAWMGGHSTINNGAAELGVYGTLGVAAAGNIPGIRYSGVSWTDDNGNLWLFGGDTVDATGNGGWLNDLWEYQPPAGSPRVARPVFSLSPGIYGSAQTVTISDATAGATIYYTTDGTIPVTTPPTPSNVYNGTITVNSTETIKAIAAAGGKANSALAGATYIINPAPTPLFSIPSGSYATALTVTISDAIGAPIYYTTDGTTPTTASNLYGGPITVNATESIEAIAVASGYSTSAVAGATYAILPPVATPSLSVASGTYTTVQTVTISDTTPGAIIYYTTDGSTPTTGSNWYKAPITVYSTQTVQAMAVAIGYPNSAVAAATYTITLPLPLGQWAWMGGSNTPVSTYVNGYNFSGVPGTYGTVGVAAAGNIPGSRGSSIGWTDRSGKLWLFGGYGPDSNFWVGLLNDLWKFDPATGQWTWMGGSNTIPPCPSNNCGRPGVYGQLGTPAAGNIPGSRDSAVSWTDSQDNFWLFGGLGMDANGVYGSLNDLWVFNPSSGQWAWMSGSNTIPVASWGTGLGQPGVYGTLGVPAAGNVPGSRTYAVSWTDSNGNLWLFGGNAYDSTGTMDSLNDLWVFHPDTRQWTWMGGSNTGGCDDNGCAPAATYGTLGTPAAGNVPGGRLGAVSWTDSNGNLWLFGGLGYESGDAFDGYSVPEGDLNDLWKFTPAIGQWAWMGGSNWMQETRYYTGPFGIYGDMATPAAANMPGGRVGALSWTDHKGNFWLYGGAGLSQNIYCTLNDLWEFSPSTQEWAWMGGNSVIPDDGMGDCVPPAAVYGTPGTPAFGNNPGSRMASLTWADGNGNFWLFGASANDLWEYQLPTASSAVTPTVTWATPVAIPYGTALTGTQLNATTGAAGTLTYTPPAGTVLNAGTQTLSVTFTPTDTNAYTTTTQTVTLTVTPAAPAVTVSCPAATYDGNSHSCSAAATGVGGTSVSGTLAITPGSQISVGSYLETATFTSANSNYSNGFGSGTLVISQPVKGTISATLNTTSIAFPNPIMIGQSAPAQYVTILSTGTAPLQVSSVTVGGANPADFKVTNQAGNCATATPATPAILISHADCNLRVIFAPVASGPRSAILYLNDDLTGSPQQVQLSGTAVSGSVLTLTATTLIFPTTTVGTPAQPQYLVLKSVGSQPVVVNQVVLSSGDFDLTNQAGTCTTALTTSLAPGANCTIRVRFHPTAKGSRSATVTINDNTATTPHTVTLNGIGQ